MSRVNDENMIDKCSMLDRSQVIGDAEETAKLYSTLTTFEESLQNMENVLLNFQTRLGGISEEIHTLQNESSKLNIEFKNSSRVKKNLDLYLENFSLTRGFVDKLLNSNMKDEMYPELLDKFIKMVQFSRIKDPLVTEVESISVSVSLPPPNQTTFVDEIIPKLEEIKLKLVSRIRQYFFTRFKSNNMNMNVDLGLSNIFGRSNSNSSSSKLILFLKECSPHVFLQVKDGYIKLVQRYFVRFFSGLDEKLNTFHYKNSVDDIGKVSIVSNLPFFAEYNQLKMDTNAALFSNSDFLDSLENYQEISMSLKDSSSTSNKVFDSVSAQIELRSAVLDFFFVYISNKVYSNDLKTLFEVFTVFHQQKTTLEYILLVLLFYSVRQVEAILSQMNSNFGESLDLEVVESIQKDFSKLLQKYVRRMILTNFDVLSLKTKKMMAIINMLPNNIYHVRFSERFVSFVAMH